VETFFVFLLRLKTWEGTESYVVARWLRRDESCRENQNTHFYVQKRSFPRLWVNADNTVDPDRL